MDGAAAKGASSTGSTSSVGSADFTSELLVCSYFPDVSIKGFSALVCSLLP
jgi:hypothetical protein